MQKKVKDGKKQIKGRSELSRVAHVVGGEDPAYGYFLFVEIIKKEKRKKERVSQNLDP